MHLISMLSRLFGGVLCLWMLMCGVIGAHAQELGKAARQQAETNQAKAKGLKVFGAGSGETRVSLFGVPSEGSKFVYVFDRSASMTGAPLAAAKRELLKSLEDIDSVHQFTVIFYNERPSVLNTNPGAPPRLLFGTDTDKKAAQKFIEGTKAGGGSAHLDALKLAVRMRPDVVYLLTDAADPQLTAAELAELRELNDGIGAVINAVEFGVGPQPDPDNFLVRIADQHRGKHAYIDLKELLKK